MGLFSREQFVHEQLPVVAHHFSADASVVVLVLDALASARVERFHGDHDFVVVIFVGFAVAELAAGGLTTLEAAVCVHAAASPLKRVPGETPPPTKDATPGTLLGGCPRLPGSVGQGHSLRLSPAGGARGIFSSANQGPLWRFGTPAPRAR